jgi:hypothetical protein
MNMNILNSTPTTLLRMRVYDEDIHYANERYNTQDYLQKIFINIVKMEENYFSRASQI